MPASKRSTNQCRQQQARACHNKKSLGAYPDQATCAEKSLAISINKQIIAASQASTVKPLLTVISQHLWQMNVINLSTAAHRLAKLVSSKDSVHVAKVRQHPVVSQLFSAILDKVDGAAAGSIQPQAISNVTWSLANLRFIENPTLVYVLAHLLAETMYAFQPFELTTTIWAFAKLVSATEGNDAAGKLAWSPKYLFEVVGEHISQSTEDYGFRCLATIAWSFASVHHRKASLFRSIARQMKGIAGEANGQEVGNTVWAFATVGYHDSDLFSMLAEHALGRLHEFKSQEISNMLWGFATNNFWHLELFVRAVEVAKTMKLYPQHLANIICAFARIQPRHPVTCTTVLALLPLCNQQICDFKPLEMCSTALAVAQVFGCYDARPQPIEILDFFAGAVPLTVLHIDGLSDSSFVNLTTALAMMQLKLPEYLEMIEAEAIRRMQYSAYWIMIKLLQPFVMMAGDCSSSLFKIASRLLADFESLNARLVGILSETIVELFHVPAKKRHLASCELQGYLRTLASWKGPAGRIHIASCSRCPLACENIEAVHSSDDDRSTFDMGDETASSQYPFDEGVQDKDFFDTYRVYVKNSFLHVEDGVSDEEEVSMSGSFSKYSRSHTVRRSSSLPPMRLASTCDGNVTLGM